MAIIRLQDFGLSFSEDGIYTSRSPFPTTRQHQERMLAEITTMIEVGSHRQGTLSEADFEQVIAALRSIGPIDREPSYREFYVGTTVAGLDAIRGKTAPITHEGS